MLDIFLPYSETAMEFCDEMLDVFLPSSETALVEE